METITGNIYGTYISGSGSYTIDNGVINIQNNNTINGDIYNLYATSNATINSVTNTKIYIQNGSVIFVIVNDNHKVSVYKINISK